MNGCLFYDTFMIIHLIDTYDLRENIAVEFETEEETNW